MGSWKFLFITILTAGTLIPTLSYAQTLCSQFLNSKASNLNSVEDHILILEKLNQYKHSNDFFTKLDPQVEKTGVRFHTSRSTHRATEEYPRHIYIDESNPKQTLVYAFSTRPALEPILEIQSFDKVKKQTNMYEVEWDVTGKPRINKNPRRCFGCHSGGRPLFTSLPSREFWPFTFAQDTEKARQMEAALSKLNNEVQFKHLSNIVLDHQWVDLLKSAFYDDTPNFNKKFSRMKSKFTREQIEDYYFDQREIFLNFLGYKNEQALPMMNQRDQLVARLIQVMQLAGLVEFVDLLSLNVRPRNYEPSSESLKHLKLWVDEIQTNDITLKKSCFWFR